MTLLCSSSLEKTPVLCIYRINITMEKQKIWVHICLLITLFYSQIVSVRTNARNCLINPSDYESLKWEKRGLCKAFDLQTSLLSGRYPHRVWEGKGHIRFLSRRTVELSCDFQQPTNIISNVIWHKATNPRATSFNLYEKRAPSDRLFNNGFLLHPFNNPNIYALNRPAGSSLFIQDASPRDFGTYRCFATRFATPFTYKYPQLITVYQDIEFYPRHLQYEVFEKLSM